MGSTKRFHLFAELIEKEFPPFFYKSVADVAGGKGYLQLALKDLGYKDVITFDKRKRTLKNINLQYRYFSPKIKNEFDLIVGMHPDEATDVIIVEAAKRNIPFIICPCCVKPSAVTYFGKNSFKNWYKHLTKLAQKLGFDTRDTILKMNGKNKVLIGRPLW